MMGVIAPLWAWALLFAEQLPGPSLTLVCVLTPLCLRYGTYTVLRVPLLCFLSALLLGDLLLYGLVRLAVRAVERVCVEGYKRRDRLMRRSSYDGWIRAGTQLDALEGLDVWKSEPESRAYNWRQVQAVTRRLRHARERAAAEPSRAAIAELESVLLPTFAKNYAGTMSAELYCKTHVGTKELIERYYDELCACLETLRAWGATSAAARAACLPFWQQARVGFGNTALLLSGGAMLGCYHYGVVRALLERRMLPRVICGTSAGAVIAAFLATRTDEEALADLHGLDRLFREQGSNGPLHGSHWWKLKRLLRHGVLYETADFLRHMDWFAKGCTFREAYLISGRVVSITCTPHKRLAKGAPPLMLNHVTAPNVTVASAVCASSCVPMLIPPVALQEKLADGSLRTCQDHDLSLVEAAGGTSAPGPALQLGPSAEGPGVESDSGALPPPLGGGGFGGGGGAAPSSQASGAASARAAARGGVGAAAGSRPPERAERENEPAADAAAAAAAAAPEACELGATPPPPPPPPPRAEVVRMRDGSFEFDVPKQALSQMFNVHFTIVSQVNPHILPFCYAAEGSYGYPNLWRRRNGGWRGGFILSTLEVWLKEDMLKLLRLMRAQRLGPEFFGVDWSHVFLQDTLGDVTLSPTVPLRDYLNVINNVSTKAELARMVAEGEQITWRAMSLVSHRQRVQRALDDAIDDPLLTNAASRAHHLASNGEPNCDRPLEPESRKGGGAGTHGGAGGAAPRSAAAAAGASASVGGDGSAAADGGDGGTTGLLSSLLALGSSLRWRPQ